MYAALIGFAACGSSDKKVKVQEQTQGPLAKSANSDAFNQSFGQVLDDYYSLKDNFVAEKGSLIDTSAKSLMISVDSLKLNELKADTNIVATAKTYTEGISSELKGLLGEKDIEGKRKSFQHKKKSEGKCPSFLALSSLPLHPLYKIWIQNPIMPWGKGQI